MFAEERQSPELYAANVRKIMGEALRAELSTHGIPQQQALKRNGIYVDWTGRYGDPVFSNYLVRLPYKLQRLLVYS